MDASAAITKSQYNTSVQPESVELDIWQVESFIWEEQGHSIGSVEGQQEMRNQLHPQGQIDRSHRLAELESELYSRSRAFPTQIFERKRRALMAIENKQQQRDMELDFFEYKRIVEQQDDAVQKRAFSYQLKEKLRRQLIQLEKRYEELRQQGRQIQYFSDLENEHIAMLKRQIKNEESEEERIMRIKAERLRARWMDKELIDVFKRYQKQLREQKSSQFDEGMNPYLKGQKQSYLRGVVVKYLRWDPLLFPENHLRFKQTESGCYFANFALTNRNPRDFENLQEEVAELWNFKDETILLTDQNFNYLESYRGSIASLFKQRFSLEGESFAQVFVFLAPARFYQLQLSKVQQWLTCFDAENNRPVMPKKEEPDIDVIYNMTFVNQGLTRYAAISEKQTLPIRRSQRCYSQFVSLPALGVLLLILILILANFFVSHKIGSDYWNMAATRSAAHPPIKQFWPARYYYEDDPYNQYGDAQIVLTEDVKNFYDFIHYDMDRYLKDSIGQDFDTLRFTIHTNRINPGCPRRQKCSDCCMPDHPLEKAILVRSPGGDNPILAYIPYISKKKAPVKYSHPDESHTERAGFYLDLPTPRFPLYQMDFLAQCLQFSRFIRKETQFVVISLLLHINGSEAFTRLIFQFYNDQYGQFRQKRPLNYLFRPNIFTDAIHSIVNILLLLALIAVAGLCIWLLVRSITGLIRVLRKLRNKGFKMTLDIWFQLLRKTLIILLVITFIIAFIATAFQMTVGVDQLTTHPKTGQADQMIALYERKRMILVFMLLSVVIFLFNFWVFSLRLALYLKVFLDMLMFILVYFVPILLFLLAISFLLSLLLGSSHLMFIDFPYVASYLLTSFTNRNIEPPFVMELNVTQTQIILTFITFLAYAFFPTLPFAVLTTLLHDGHRVVQEIQAKSWTINRRRACKHWAFRTCKKTKSTQRHQEIQDQLKPPPSAAANTETQTADTHSDAPASARALLNLHRRISQ